MNKSIDLTYDEGREVLIARLYRIENAEHVHTMFNEVRNMMGDRKLRYEILDATDFQQNSIPADARKAFRKHIDFIKSIEKFAVVGAINLNRMVARIVCATMGITRALKFYKRKEEAMIWIQETS